jgi:hypothetical protein
VAHFKLSIKTIVHLLPQRMTSNIWLLPEAVVVEIEVEEARVGIAQQQALG